MSFDVRSGAQLWVQSNQSATLNSSIVVPSLKSFAGSVGAIVPAAQLALIALVEPTLSPLWAWLASGELPPIWTFIGGAVIVAAIAIQALFATRKKRHARKASLDRRGQPAFDHS